MSLYQLNLAPSAASAVTVCASQSPGAGAITLNGSLVTAGVATFAAAQLVTLVSGGNDAGITFTITGTDADGNTVTNDVTGAGIGTATSSKHFKTVTGITHTGSVAGTLTSGNSIDSVSPSFQTFRQGQLGRFSLGVLLVSGTATYETQDCYTNIKDAQESGTWISSTVFTAKTASFAASYGDLFPTAVRLRTTASSSGVLQGNFVCVKG